MKQAQYYLYENYGLPPHVVLGVDGRTVELIEHLVESERTLRQMRIALLWPGVEQVEGGLPAGGASA